jgi:hypothetical protein
LLSSISNLSALSIQELIMNWQKNILISLLMIIVITAASVTARADAFEAPPEVENLVKKFYKHYQYWGGSKCLLIEDGHEFCALAIDKSAEANPDVREIDMLLTISDQQGNLQAHKILKNWLDSDAMSLSIAEIQFNIWRELKSDGKIFSIITNQEGSSRVYGYYGKDLTFFKLSSHGISLISDPLPIYRFRSENNGSDKFSRTISRRIIVIKDQGDQQLLVVRASLCEDDDTVLEKNDCEHKKLKWKNEKMINFNDKFITFSLADI